MIRNRLYYVLKPWIPRGLRIKVRQLHAARIRRRCSEVWPILPGSNCRPDGWQGWPGGAKFALVLTHDVEGPRGLSRSLDLMRIERELGFRSSFNFIPEGTYKVPAAIRQEIIQNGFEVGVHDLKHNGKLYASRDVFRRNARIINTYLAEWGAVGFRSGFMLNALDWLHDLNIKYDASSFDTDPFEPQPRGRGTLYPFWVPRPDTIGQDGFSRSGYVELPYTLPQDSTLFILLGEKSPSIWVKKLDWIAEAGGMALVNVHPDYIRFDGDPVKEAEYPIEYYREFLRIVRHRYGTDIWQPVASEMASFVEVEKFRLKRPQPRRICMVTHSFYESDNRVLRYAETLVDSGNEVDVYAIRGSREMLKTERIRGVNVFRIQDRFGKTQVSSLAYLGPLLLFLARSFIRITRADHDRPYDLIHIHNVPDFMIFAALYPRSHGTRTILDIHDIVPEFFGSKFGNGSKGVVYRLLLLMERVSASLADEVIIANDLWLQRYMARTGTEGRCRSIINYVDSRIFRPRHRARDDGKLIILFPGGLQYHQGVDIAIRAFGKIVKEIPEAEFHIYGDGSEKPALLELVAQLGVEEKVLFFQTQCIREIAAVMANADLGVVPKRADSFGNEAYSTKIMEFMASGVPVIVSGTKVDRHYFNDSIVRFFESGDVSALACEMLEMLSDEELRRNIAARALRYTDLNSWERQKGRYLDLVDCLTS